MADRVVVFFDYQNVHGWARRLFQPIGCHPAVGHIDPLATARHLVSRRLRPSVLTQARVYRGRPNPDKQPGATRANDRQAAMWSASGLVDVTRRNLVYAPDWPDIPPQEKGIDVAIAVDMMAMALRKEMDAAILFSSDKDLLPALESIYAERLCHVEVACWSGGRRIKFDGNQLPWCHFIDQQTYRALEDTTDYAALDYSR